MGSWSVSRTLCAASVLSLALAPAPSWAESGAAQAARAYLQQNLAALGLTPADADDVQVSSEVASGHNGVTHVYLQQRYRGIDVHTGIVTVNVAADGHVISAGSRFVANIAEAAAGQRAARGPAEAVQRALGHLQITPTRPLRLLRRLARSGASATTVFSDGGMAASSIETRQVWYPSGSQVRLAWLVEIEEAGGQHWWNAFVDAETGASLGQRGPDRPRLGGGHRQRDRAPARAPRRPARRPRSRPPTARATTCSRCPSRARTTATAQLVTERGRPRRLALRLARHRRRRGPEFTVTRGNNVHAYADRDNNNVADPGSDPDGGAGLLLRLSRST